MSITTPPTSDESGLDAEPAKTGTVEIWDENNLVAEESAAQATPEVAPMTEKEIRKSKGAHFVTIFWLGAFHVGALLALNPAYFSWEALALGFFMYWLSGSVGICLGFHRYLTHRGFKTSRFMHYFFAFVGGLAGEGSALAWIANHRKHHAHSDQDGDPHTPDHGGWWSHMNWLGWVIHGPELEDHFKKWAPDLLADKGIRLLDQLFLPIHIVVIGATMASGYFYGAAIGKDPVTMMMSFLVWGVFVRMVWVLHITWAVNSIGHMWGYRNYETRDHSTNSWLVGLLAFGEGWHNNHHAYPRMAVHGHKWWEIDLTYALIRLLRLCGLVWNVVDYKTISEKKARDKSSQETSKTSTKK
ncbi:MAG: acyl-CoA desaturase [Pirellulaceae bacterium]|nr:acyl-CoA desaturase [Pirellulaceae bacterium]